MEQRIKAVKIYQAVTFERRSETHFTVLPVTGRTSPALSFNKELMCIDIKSANDHILVPLTNVAAIYLWNEEADEYIDNAEKAKKSKSTLKAQDIK